MAGFRRQGLPQMPSEGWRRSVCRRLSGRASGGGLREKQGCGGGVRGFVPELRGGIADAVRMCFVRLHGGRRAWRVARVSKCVPPSGNSLNRYAV